MKDSLFQSVSEEIQRTQLRLHKVSIAEVALNCSVLQISDKLIDFITEIFLKLCFFLLNVIEMNTFQTLLCFAV